MNKKILRKILAIEFLRRIDNWTSKIFIDFLHVINNKDDVLFQIPLVLVFSFNSLSFIDQDLRA